MIMKIDTQGMSFGDGTTGKTLEEQRAAIPDNVPPKRNILTDSLKKELKDLINEVLDERQLSNTTVTPQDYSYNLFDQNISINTEGTDVITFT